MMKVTKRYGKELRNILRKSSEESEIRIGWIPGHIKVEENEEADKAANETWEEDQKEVEINWEVCKTAIESGLKQKV